jgi:hypothetical protein
MPQSPIYNISGLFTSPNEISGVPPGSLSRSQNVDLSQGLAQCRRGYDLLNSFSDTSYRASRLFDYQDYIYGYISTNSTFYNYVGGSWVSRGAVTKPTNALVPRHVFQNQALYVMSSTGLKKTDLYTTSFFDAGLPAGVATVLTMSTSSGTAIVASSPAKQVNYRWLIAKKDANNYLIQGPVSSSARFTSDVTNPKDVCVVGYLPSGLSGTETVQVYRTDTLTLADDECKLVYEYPLSAANVTSTAKSITSADTGTEVLTSAAHGFQDGTVVQVTLGTLVGPSASTNYIISDATTNTFKLKTLAGVVVNITTSGTATVTSQVAFGIFDLTPTALRGANLYTNAGENGISQNNVRPPISSDLAVYKDYLFYADTTSKQLFNLAIISTLSGTGITLADTITITSGVTDEIYTAAAAEVFGTGSGSFLLDGSAGSTGIDNTARSLVGVINRCSALVTATLVYTDSNSLPGKILLEARNLGAAAFALKSSRPAAFSPQLPTVATTASTSTADTFRNGLMWSRQAQPEAVPPIPLRVGSASDPIVRILALRDGLVIFKAKDGAYILRGDSPGNFSVQVLDSTAKIIAPESLSVVNGLIYGLFEGGICSVSDTSVEIISAPVKDKIQTLFGTALQKTKDYSFGISYEADNKYILSLPAASTSTYADYQLVYDVSTNLFSEYNIHTTAGYVSSVNQKLYLASGNSAYVKQERKAFDQTDFCDYLGVKTILSYVDKVLTISTGIDEFSIGDLVSQGTDQCAAYVTAIDLVASTITVDFARTWDTGVATLDHYAGIECVLEFNPNFADNPSGLKLMTEISMVFKQPIIRSAVIGFSNDSTLAVSEVEIEGDDASSGWGVGSFGIMPWGGLASPNPERVGIPRGVSRCNSLKVSMTHKVSQSDWQLEGLAISYEPLSKRTAR